MSQGSPSSKKTGDKINSNQSEDRTPYIHDPNLSFHRDINLLNGRMVTRYLPFVIPMSEYESGGLPNYYC